MGFLLVSTRLAGKIIRLERWFPSSSIGIPWTAAADNLIFNAVGTALGACRRLRTGSLRFPDISAIRASPIG
jgi:hypothetical protein